ncbi:MAG: hypothetical protein IPK69_07005 [Phycisphaerales bacterium]|nr:MAG: hypothetical protein IPK69_07005 [Phycisphaerales bacterium]
MVAHGAGRGTPAAHAPIASPVSPTPPTTRRETPPPGELTNDEIWALTLERCATNRRVRLLLDGSRLLSMTREAAAVEVHPGVHTMAQVALAEIAEAISWAAGRGVRVELVRAAASEASIDDGQTSNATEHPLVKSAIELFKARVIRVERRPKAEPEA